MTEPQRALVICSAPDSSHDSDFVRLRLLEMLYDLGAVRAEVASVYDPAALVEADLLITYAARESPDAAACEAVRGFLDRGGRWLSLHVTSAVPADNGLPAILGARFLAHPPYSRFTVSVTSPNDALLDGIEPFEVEDELYVMDLAEDIEVLLHSQWGGLGLAGEAVDEATRPLMYRRRAGAGEVLYLALGHCNRAGVVVQGETSGDRRGAWASPVFNRLVRRGIEWAARRD